MKSLKELAAETDPATLRALGALRRLAISVTAKALWQLVGFRQGNGQPETMPAEPFTGIGIAARPPANGKPEAIVVMIGDAGSPVIVAVRDEKTRASIAGALLEDETATFNSKSIFLHKADGTMEARSAGGTAKRLITVDDYDALVEWINTAMVVNVVGGAPAAGTTTVPPSASGTTKLKGE